jgi:hypothetical protein
MKEIKLLEEQLSKLENKDFDFKSWKQYTIILLSKIFGNDNQKVKQIEKIEVDYSSWSLRDASGKSSHLETCKILGKEILLAAIDELKSFGLPETNLSSEGFLPVQIIASALENALKVSQYKEMIATINSDNDIEIKKRDIEKLLTAYGGKTSVNILTDVLSNKELKGKL